MEIVKDDEWGLYPNFTKDEMKCHFTGFCFMTHKMMKTLQDIRNIYGKPMIISSGYRDVSNPIERVKPSPGEHTFGEAADILICEGEALDLLKIALDYGVRRVGLSQKGETSTRFIHLGVGDTDNNRFPQSIWTY